MTRIIQTLSCSLFLFGAVLVTAAPAMAEHHRYDRHYAGRHAGGHGAYRSRHRGLDHHKRHGYAPQSWAWRPRARYSHRHGHYPRYYSGYRYDYRPYHRRHGYAGYAPWFVYPRPVVRVRPGIEFYIYGY